MLTALVALALTAVPFTFTGEGLTVTVAANGAIRVTGKVDAVATIDSAGKVVVKGKAVARINADGTAEILRDQPMKIGKFDDKGALTVATHDGRRLVLGFGADGVLTGGEFTTPVKVTPANDPAVNRRALLLFILLSAGA